MCVLSAVPPSWSQEPMDSRALLKSDLMLPCLAIGMPRPNVQWFRGMQNSYVLYTNSFIYSYQHAKRALNELMLTNFDMNMHAKNSSPWNYE